MAMSGWRHREWVKPNHIPLPKYGNSEEYVFYLIYSLGCKPYFTLFGGGEEDPREVIGKNEIYCDYSLIKRNFHQEISVYHVKYSRDLRVCLQKEIIVKVIP